MISVHLTKYYGEHLAVDDISFEISEGHFKRLSELKFPIALSMKTI